MNQFWTDIYEKAKAAKAKFANEDDYKQPHNKYGEEFGYTLKPPYTIGEVNECEKNINTPLPSDLKTYLLNISREFCANTYPHVFELPKKLRSCRFPNNCTYASEWDEIECCKCNGICKNNDDSYNNGYDDHDFGTGCCLPNCGQIHSLYHGMVQIGFGGCTNEDYIVIKGSNVGSVYDFGSGNPHRISCNIIQYLMQGLRY